MTLPDQHRIERLRRRLEELDLWAVRAGVALEGWSFNDAPLAHGAAWPTRDGVAALALDGIEVPADWPLEEARLDVDLGGEGLLRIAYADGGDDAFGLDPNHQRFPLKARRFAVRAEMVARLPFGVPNRDARLARARLVRIDPELAELTLLLHSGRATPPRCLPATRSSRRSSPPPRTRWPSSTGRPPPCPTSPASRPAGRCSGSGSCPPTSRPIRPGSSPRTA